MAIIHWNQVRVQSSKHDTAELKYFRDKTKADEYLQKASTMDTAERELICLGRLIRRRRVSHFFVSRRRMVHNHYSHGLRVLEQAVRFCRRRAKRQKKLHKRTQKRLLESASKLEKVITVEWEALLELVMLYDSGNIIKVLGGNDISAIRKIRDDFPNKLIRFSVGSSVRSRTVGEIELAAKQLLEMESVKKSCIYELRHGVLYQMTQAQARGLGVIP